jgi:hypothetical protein
MDQTFAAIKRSMWAIGEQGCEHAVADAALLHEEVFIH